MPKSNKTAKLKRIKIKYCAIIFALVVILLALNKLQPVFMRYYFRVSTIATGYAKATRSDSFTVTFHSNGGTGQMDTQSIKYGVSTALRTNTYERTDYTFTGWNTAANGSGTSYSDGDSINKTVEGNIDLYAQWIQGVAIIVGDSTPYYTLQAAVNAVPNNGTQKTIKLLKNVNEKITVQANQNIVFNFQNYTLNNNGNNRVIENRGTIELANGTIQSSALHNTAANVVAIYNYSTGTVRITGGQITINNNINAIINEGLLEMSGGTITTIASTNGAVNNNSTGTIRMSGGIIDVNGGRQAIYNDNGIVEISGNAYLKTIAVERATVQNQSSGTLTITGGTIIATAINNKGAVNNAGTMTIGTEGGNVNRNTPIIQGADYGITSTTNFSFYDGIIKGKTNPVDNMVKLNVWETGYDIANSVELINGETYKTIFLAIADTVTFDANGGTLTDSNGLTVSETTVSIEDGTAIGILPEPNLRAGFVFLGWFTLSADGDEVTPSTLITGNVRFYAHWIQAKYAEVNGIQYDSIVAAITAVPNNTETTVTILRDTKECFTIPKNKNIVLDIQNYTLTNNGDIAIITNEGTLKIINGNLRSNAGSNATINNMKTGVITISGGNIISTGTRSALYNNTGGIVQITGDAYLSSTASGTPNGVTMERGTVHNLTGGTITITGGTIVGLNQQAVSNQGTLTLGTKDGNISTTSPNIIGKTYGIKSDSVFNYYDGIIKGITNPPINGTITDQEDDTLIASATEVIDAQTYTTNWLELIP